jgi:hypothetical protein
MKYFYSASTNGFYIEGVNSPESIPSDVKEITEERYDEIFRIHTSELKIIQPDSDGYPTLVDMPPPPIEVIESDVRNQRNNLLRESDVVVVRAFETGQPVSDTWKTYRQALRDVPAQTGFPSNVVWPTIPS